MGRDVTVGSGVRVRVGVRVAAIVAVEVEDGCGVGVKEDVGTSIGVIVRVGVRVTSAVAVDVEDGRVARASACVGVGATVAVHGVSVTSTACCWGAGVQETAETRRQIKGIKSRLILAPLTSLAHLRTTPQGSAGVGSTQAVSLSASSC